MLLSSAEFMTKQLSRVTQLKKLIRPGSKHAEHMSPLQKQRSETVRRDQAQRNLPLLVFQAAGTKLMKHCLICYSSCCHFQVYRSSYTRLERALIAFDRTRSVTLYALARWFCACENIL
jgi:hypothetical protein